MMSGGGVNNLFEQLPMALPEEVSTCGAGVGVQWRQGVTVGGWLAGSPV